MIIRGLGKREGRAGPMFSANPQLVTRSFSGILSNRSALFLQSAPTASDFFLNCQLAMRSFFAILSNRSEDFFETSARDPEFF